MSHPPRQPRCRNGFTLLELSIALVIIGLIIGGVLVGRDLISAAQVKAQVQQLNGYQVAINNFRLRYRGLPGDLPDATSQFSSSKWPNLADGDGNGIVGSGDIDEVAAVYGGEYPQFWYHLTAAGMIDEQFDGRDGWRSGDFSYEDGYGGGSFPKTRVGNGGIVAFGRNGDGNYLVIGFGVRILVNNRPYMQINNALTPEEAKGIDQKMDDGLPLQGLVQATSGSGNLWAGPNTYEMSSMLPSPLSSGWALALNLLGEWMVPSAHAFGEVREGDRSKACAFTKAGEGEEAAYYATEISAVNCALHIRLQ